MGKLSHLRPNTGLIPYLVFVHASTGMSHAITGNAAVLQLPPVSSFDVIAARGLLEIATDIIVAVILLAGFACLGVAALPDNLWTSSHGQHGVDKANPDAKCGRRQERYRGQLTRILYFASGIFYVPAMMPRNARNRVDQQQIMRHRRLYDGAAAAAQRCVRHHRL
jgi:hypothetical protein